MSNVFTQNIGRGLGDIVENISNPPDSFPFYLDQEFTTGNKRSWGAKGLNYSEVDSTYPSLPAGVYSCFNSDSGPFVRQIEINIDDLLKLPDTLVDDVLDEFDTFWKLEPEFRKRGFLMKRGILLHGKPGSGKTSGIQLMIKQLIDELNGIVVIVDHPQVSALCIHMLRRIEPHRKVLAVLEDLDALVIKYDESAFLALLDGESQIDNVMFVGTTNYIQDLDPRFIDRPSRFDTIKEICMPSAAARHMYLNKKEPDMSDDERDMWVNMTEGFSIAHLKELIISVKCFGRDLHQSVEILQRMREIRAGTNGEGFGFNRPKKKSPDPRNWRV